mmetsp:Transcript_13651/g.25748  ORF Transcript_13651/g.25748 Transcript_13651/m.25748 type:complete len:93 (-) Transcript_13651:979-1257(-)
MKGNPLSTIRCGSVWIRSRLSHLLDWTILRKLSFLLPRFLIKCRTASTDKKAPTDIPIAAHFHELRSIISQPYKYLSSREDPNEGSSQLKLD